MRNVAAMLAYAGMMPPEESAKVYVVNLYEGRLTTLGCVEQMAVGCVRRPEHAAVPAKLPTGVSPAAGGGVSGWTPSLPWGIL